MHIGMDFFSGKMKKEQMTGRPYLKTDTGALKQSWFVKSEIVAMGIIAKLATRSKYARIHQYGGTINHPGGTPYIVTEQGTVFMRKDGNYPPQVKFTKPHSIKIPKRLQLFESFKKEGGKILSRHIAKALIRAYR